jgi:hypothetical protein
MITIGRSHPSLDKQTKQRKLIIKPFLSSWGLLDVETFSHPNTTEEIQAYAAGYLEG